jgi:hypothetical protein
MSEIQTVTVDVLLVLLIRHFITPGYFFLLDLKNYSLKTDYSSENETDPY